MSQSLCLALNNPTLVAAWVLSQRADCTSVSVHRSQLTHYPHPLSLSAALPEDVTDCRTTGTSLRETVWILFLSFHFCPLFLNLLKHMLSHKAGILPLNCSSCHTLACQETVGGHVRSCGCRCIYKYLFILTPEITTSTMCHNPPRPHPPPPPVSLNL